MVFIVLEVGQLCSWNWFRGNQKLQWAPRWYKQIPSQFTAKCVIVSELLPAHSNLHSPSSPGLCGPTTSLAMRRTTQFRRSCTSTSVTRRWVRRAAWQWSDPAGTCPRPAPASWSSTCRSVKLWVRHRPASPTPPWSAPGCEPALRQTRLDKKPPPRSLQTPRSCREWGDSEGLQGRTRKTPPLKG